MFLNLLFDLSTSNGFTFHFSPGPSSWRCEWPRPRADPKSPARLARTRTCVRVWKACAAEAKAAPGVALHQAPRSDGRWDLARPAQDLRLGLCGTKSRRRIYLPFLFPSAFFFPLGLRLLKKHAIGILLPQTCRVLRNEDVSPHRSCPARLKGPDAPAFATGPRSRRAARPVIGATLSDGLRSVPTFRKVR